MRYSLLLLVLLLHSCVGTDLVDFPIGEDQSALSFQEDELILEVGETSQTSVNYTLADGTVGTNELVYSSDDTNVAEVSSSGLVTAVGSGQTVVRVVAQDINMEAELFVSVAEGNNPVTLSLTASSNVVQIGETLQLEVTAMTLSGNTVPPTGTVNYTSSDESIITVNADGLITAVAPGKANVRASDDLLTSAPFEITVSAGSRTAQFVGVNGYSVSGGAELTDTELSFLDDFVTQSGPGLYVYLSNSPNSVGGGVELGAVMSNSGAQSYTIPDGVLSSEFEYVIIYCKPFGIAFGRGEFN